MSAQRSHEPPARIERVRSSRAYNRAQNVAALAAPELALAPFFLRRVRRRWAVPIVAGSVAFVAAIAVVIFVWNAANEKTARQATARLGAALIHNDANAAPPGAAAYVTGVRTYFGPVASAKLIGAHQKTVGEDPNTRSFFVADLLLDTRRGPAVVEVEFDNGAVNSDQVSSVYELAPSAARGVSAAQRRKLDAAFKTRGHTAADASSLARAAPTAAVHRASSPVVSPASKRLHCVQAAHGDVTKLVRCSQ